MRHQLTFAAEPFESYSEFDGPLEASDSALAYEDWEEEVRRRSRARRLPGSRRRPGRRPVPPKRPGRPPRPRPPTFRPLPPRPPLAPVVVVPKPLDTTSTPV